MKVPQRFMVIDDDRTNNMICEFSMRRFSAATEIKTFTNPEVALQFIEESYEDKNTTTSTVMFLDINMPLLTAWDFLDIFNDFKPHVKEQFVIYILTSSIDYRDKQKADTNPLVEGTLCKPLSTSIIKSLFTTALNASADL